MKKIILIPFSRNKYTKVRTRLVYLFGIVFILLLGLQNTYANDNNTDTKESNDGVIEIVQSGVSSFFDGKLYQSIVLWATQLEPLGAEGEIDPWENFNRVIYDFNSNVDIFVKPVASNYIEHTPNFVRLGVSNFFANLFDVNTIVNQTLQLKLKPSFESIGRIVLNTTFGLGGLLEVQHRPIHKEDFGQTLGYWGVGDGPYLVLPFLGPRTLRDGVSIIVDIAVFDKSYNLLIGEDITVGVNLLNIVRARASVLQITNLLEEAYDPYTSLRNAYLQRRSYDIADGQILDDEEF